MSSEDQDILAKISQLAGAFATTKLVCISLTRLSGQINRHKNTQPSDSQTQFAPSSRSGNRGGMSVLNYVGVCSTNIHETTHNQAQFGDLAVVHILQEVTQGVEGYQYIVIEL
jgi:hypothetical protein